MFAEKKLGPRMVANLRKQVALLAIAGELHRVEALGDDARQRDGGAQDADAAGRAADGAEVGQWAKDNVKYVKTELGGCQFLNRRLVANCC